MIEKLHYITQGGIEGYSHADLANIACQNGVKWVQFRMKEVGQDEYLEEALKLKSICQKYDARLIINDNVSVAKEIEADGVHLGKGDMDPLEARQILGESRIIGATANTLDDIRKLSTKKVDYIGLGPFRFTTTKKKLSPVLGIEGYKNILGALNSEGINIPVIAIGGINAGDIKEILETGVYGIALASVINAAEDKASVIREIINELNYGEVAHS